MPQITLQKLGLKADILVDLPDYVAGSTTWKQRAQVQDLVYSPSQMKVYVSVKIFAYTLDEAGEWKWLQQIAGIDDFMIADASTIVNEAGEYLIKDAPVGLSEEEMEAQYPELVGINWLREGEAFCIKAQTQALWVHEMIKAKVSTKYAIPENPPIPEP